MDNNLDKQKNNFRLERRYPNYMTGFEETEHTISSMEELELVDWVANWKNSNGFYSFAISKSRWDDSPHTLMVLQNYDEEYGGCKLWWAIGYIWGDSIEDLVLQEYSDLIGNHKDGCPKKTWQHNECNCGFKD